MADRPPNTVHFSQIGHFSAGHALAREQETYRAEVAWLIAAGHAGRHVLIKGDQVVGVWDTLAEALAEGYRRFPSQPIMVRPVREYEPILRAG